MRAIAATATVTSEGKLMMQIPQDIPQGEHQVILVIDDQKLIKENHQPLKFSAYPVGLVSESFTFRREELYDD